MESKGVQGKLVLFGAGKIGRSFIGQLFGRGGYEVVFVDIFKPVIDELNKRGQYNVIICEEERTTITVSNVRAVWTEDRDEVIHEVATADIVAVSVGLAGLKGAIPMIAEALQVRYKDANAAPLDVIIAENIRNGAEYVAGELRPLLPSDFPLEERVGLIETSIGKMVPIMTKADMEADILQVFAEAYNSLILDKKGFKNPIPPIEGLAPKEHIKAWVDRKLFIHNLGHATTAYWGYYYHPKATYLWEVLEDERIYKAARATMTQAAALLLKQYPGEFTLEALTDHIDDLLRRFRNKALGDTVFRVGCDLKRKLSAEDRVAGAIHLALRLNMPYDQILRTLVVGCHFRAVDESGNMLSSDKEFETIYRRGLSEVMTTISGFDPTADAELISNAIEIDRTL